VLVLGCRRPSLSPRFSLSLSLSSSPSHTHTTLRVVITVGPAALLRVQDYLETKRIAFPRFYFLSNEELLQILAQTRDAQAVQVCVCVWWCVEAKCVL
jgi:hypothetical protein